MKLKSLSQKDRYGNMFSVEFFEPDASIPMMMMIPDMADGYNGADSSNHPGEPKGTDTVPAWLTPGENVVNAEASRLPGNQEKIDEMNEQGRAIQQAQGGPIPTYQSQGGAMPAASIDGNKFVKAAQAVGLPTDKLTLNKIVSLVNQGMSVAQAAKAVAAVPNYAAGGMEIPRYDGMLNSLGNKLSARDGGPMYSAAGDFVTDDLLDRLRMVESGGDANATSEVGAMGQYQIMPATAQQPGYGVTPLAVEDIRDPEKSREFARQYLMGIAAANPDFTEDEVITAYHSGAGNVRKAKDGAEALGPRGQAYATKVANAEVPPQNDFPPELADRGVNPEDLFQANQKPGMMSAMAQTNATPPLPDADEQAAGMRFNAAVPEYMRNRKMEGKTDYGDVIYDSGGVPQAVNPNRISPDAKQKIIDKFVENNDQEMYDRRMAEYEQAVKQDKARKKYEADQSALETKQKEFARDEEISSLESRKEEAVAKGDIELANALQNEIDGVPPVDEKPPEVKEEKSANDKSRNPIINNVIKAGADKKQPGTDAGSTNEVITKGEEVEPSTLEKVKGFIKEAFGDLFNPKEIARMAILYAGSRALGYDHEGSFSYSTKSYMKRLEQKEKQEYELVKANAKNYTTKSFNKYIQTRDMDDLEAAVEEKERKAGDYLYVPIAGGNKPSVDIDGVPHVSVRDISGPDGKPDGKVNSYDLENAINVGGVKTVDNIHNPTTVAKEFSSNLDTLEKTLNKRRGADKKDSKVAALGLNDPSVANKAMSLYFQDLREFKADPAAAYRLKSQMTDAINDWAEAMAAFADAGGVTGDKDDPSKSLSAFYFKRRIKDRVDVAASAFGETSAENMVAIYRDTSAGLTDKQTEDVYKRALRLFNIAKQNKNINMKGFDFKGTKDGFNGFSFFLHQLNLGDPRAIKVYEEAKKVQNKKE